jgi:hypothetical protein
MLVLHVYKVFFFFFGTLPLKLVVPAVAAVTANLGLFAINIYAQQNPHLFLFLILDAFGT